MFRNFAALLAITVIPAHANAGNLRNPLHMRVHVWNEAATPPSVVAQALQECSRIFKNAGIVIDWSSAPSNSPRAFLVVIASAPSPRATGNALGYTFNDSSGWSAVVVWPRVKALVSYMTCSGEILGRVMAHELGHLLIGQRRHSDFGVMRALWSLANLRADQGALFVFTKDDVAQMHENLTRATVASPIAATADCGVMRVTAVGKLCPSRVRLQLF
jgi:hypothetical protein